MIRYIIKRLLYLIPVILCVSFIIFALMDLTPGTVVDSMIPSDATPELIAAIRAQYDMDEPMMSRAAGTVILPSMVSGWQTTAGISLMPSATMSMAA